MTSTNLTAAEAGDLTALPEAFRHPHVTRFIIEPSPYRPDAYQAKYEFKPFVGTEPRPERPNGVYHTDLTSVQCEGVIDLYNAMLGAWSRAGFTAAVRDHLTDADTAWKAWTAADKALAEAYTAFDGLADGTWRSDRMALHDLQDAMLKAAEGFDSAAGALARLQETHWHDMWHSMGEWASDAETTSYDDVATEMGISTDGWRIGDASDYTSWTRPLTGRTQKTVAEQNERLDRAAADISSAGEGVLELVGGIRAELETVRAERDQAAAAHRAETERMQERLDGLADDASDRASERDIALRERDHARAELDDDKRHADCAWTADLEAAKASIDKTAAERDAARTEAAGLRTQRVVILVCAGVVIVVLALAAVIGATS
jgi:hypothetical protein